MPLHSAPVSRRSFLLHTSAAVASVTLLDQAWGATARNPNQIALLSDTHIPSSPDVIARDTNMTANLRQVVREVIALPEQPAGVFFNGDCAYLKGLKEDYTNLAQCVAPLTEAGLTWHAAMGNHDDRNTFYEVLSTQKPSRPLVASRHVSIVETPHLNWFLLDSLTQVNVVTGEIGPEQSRWLAEALEARRHKPAVVMVHHNPQFTPPEEGKPWGGIKDTTAFMELLNRHEHVKGLFFGHSHNWSVTKQGRLHLVNLPPVAYIFTAGKPNGWVLAHAQEKGLSLELRTIDPAHPQNKERHTLEWS